MPPTHAHVIFQPMTSDVAYCDNATLHNTFDFGFSATNSRTFGMTGFVGQHLATPDTID